MKELFSQGMGSPSLKHEIGTRTPKMGELPSSTSQKTFNRQRDKTLTHGTLNVFEMDKICLTPGGIKITDKTDLQSYSLNRYQKVVFTEPDQHFRKSRRHFLSCGQNSMERLISPRGACDLDVSSNQSSIKGIKTFPRTSCLKELIQ